MATLGKDSRGSRYIQFENRDRQRKTLRLGKVPKRDAEKIRHHMADLVSAQITGGVPSAETARWLAGVSDQLSEKLSRVGLTEDRNRGTLGSFIEQYVASRTDVKVSTKKLWKSTHNSLIEFFGGNRPLRGITKGDAKAWRLSIATGRAENTVRKRTAVAKSLFNSAIEHELIEVNPFVGLASTIVENRARDYFVTADEAAKVLEACPDTDWRVIFALCRWGGLRCPSEVLALRWGDILWDKQRFVVQSPKTGYRVCPLFPELVPVLNEAWDIAADGAEFVVTKQRDATSNFRTTMTKIVTRAGLKPWPKLFHALRASRATELADNYPGHVAAAWLGHSSTVANKHYRQVTDDHFDSATKSAALCAVESAGNTLQADVAEIANALNAGDFNSLRLMYSRIVGDEGLEPPTSTV